MPNERKRVDHHLAELSGLFAENVGAKETLHLQVLDDVEIHEGDDLDSGFVTRNEQTTTKRHVLLLHVGDDFSDHSLQKTGHVGMTQVHEGIFAATDQRAADLLDKVQIRRRNAEVLLQIHVLVLWVHFICFTGSVRNLPLKTRPTPTLSPCRYCSNTAMHSSSSRFNTLRSISIRTACSFREG